MAVLKESINTVTCGSVQILEVLVPAGGVTVTPGRGVTAPGVSVSGNVVGVAINNVEVAVGGGGASVVGAAQPAKRVNPIKRIDRVFVFMLISSPTNYIPHQFTFYDLRFWIYD
jgi:hypothetical protein